MNRQELEAILADIKIFDRKFIVTPVTVYPWSEATHELRPVLVLGWHLQVCYDEPDVDTGKVELQKSREWFVSETATETDVVDTAFAAVMRSYDHVVKEHFTYKGLRIYSPHFTIAQRLAMAVPCPVCKGPHDDVKHRAVRAQERSR